MKWPIILAVSPAGILMGIFLVLGIGSPGVQVVLWTLFCLATAFWLAQAVLERWLLHAVLIGVIWGALQYLVVFLFFDSFQANNPGMAGVLYHPPFLSLRYWFLISGPFAGLGTGLFLGFFTWMGKWLLGRLRNR